MIRKWPYTSSVYSVGSTFRSTNPVFVYTLRPGIQSLFTHWNHNVDNSTSHTHTQPSHCLNEAWYRILSILYCTMWFMSGNTIRLIISTWLWRQGRKVNSVLYGGRFYEKITRKLGDVFSCDMRCINKSGHMLWIDPRIYEHINKYKFTPNEVQHKGYYASDRSFVNLWQYKFSTDARGCLSLMPY